ncbi:MAG: ABC transporter substrate-binding protein [Rhizobiales bacterium]|nr:ABC transporter substrate-binding protein [Hyphomicrobiales bacterium]
MRNSRREFLGTLSAAGLAGFAGSGSALASEAPPEVSTVRLSKVSGVCIAPQYVADELLRTEGFTDVRYIESAPGLAPSESVARGELDFIVNFAPSLVIPMATTSAIKVLAGIHPGCFELFAKKGVRGIIDLKGRSVGVQGVGSIPACVPRRHGELCRSGSPGGHQLGDEPVRQTERAVC